MATMHVENLLLLSKAAARTVSKNQQYNNTFGGKVQHLPSFNREARQHVLFLMNPQLLE